MQAPSQGIDTLFILLGAVMVLAMHAGFAFLELGTVRRKNQVNALVKILVDFSVSTVAYFLVGYGIAYGTSFFVGAEQLADIQQQAAAVDLPEFAIDLLANFFGARFDYLANVFSRNAIIVGGALFGKVDLFFFCYLFWRGRTERDLDLFRYV